MQKRVLRSAGKRMVESQRRTRSHGEPDPPVASLSQVENTRQKPKTTQADAQRQASAKNTGRQRSRKRQQKPKVGLQVLDQIE